LHGTYQNLIEEHYSFVDGNGDRYIRPPGEKPTLRQFLYHARHLLGAEQKLRRKGDKQFELNHRPKLGHSTENCLGIGHIYEIDATIADVFLVSSRDRSKIIGKPTLYLIIDRESRLIVGWYAGLEAASWMAAMTAIISIAEDKEAVCRRYNVPYDPSDWPAHGIFPQIIFGDRGEMISQNSNHICDGLAIAVANAPSGRADRKGNVECRFKLLTQTLAENTPGYEPSSNFRARQGKKYDKDASMNLDEFIREIMLCIITHNRKAIKDYPLTSHQLLQNLIPTPINLWNDDLHNRRGALTRYSAEFVRMKLMPREYAVITQQGIEFRGCYYSCHQAEARGWFVKAGKKRNRIEIRYDPRLVDQVYLEDPEDRAEYITASLTARSEDYKGLSFDEVAAYEYLRSKKRSEVSEYNHQVMSDYNMQSSPAKRQARAETQAVTQGKSRHARKNNIREDRLSERQERRQVEARMPQPAASERNDKTGHLPNQQLEATPAMAKKDLKQRMRELNKEMLHG
jgi:putative transposase